MTIYCIDPLVDHRWPVFVDAHPRASVFHTQGWLDALASTYGYRPVAFTTAAPGENIERAVVFCEVCSSLTGRRLVSLPFSDHCKPLTDSDDQAAAILEQAIQSERRQGWRYVEVRGGISHSLRGFSPYSHSWQHIIDLAVGVEAIFRSFHRDCVQRKIRKAEREGVTCEHGTSHEQLIAFYRLFVQTRLRHQVPPQPLSWFRRLLDGFAGKATISVARHRSRPIGAVLTLRHGRTLVYKYGASDANSHSLGAMSLLFWQVALAGFAAQCTALDLGRSETHHSGLVRFKEHLGATRLPLTWWRSGAHLDRRDISERLVDYAKPMLSYLPGRCHITVGRFLYRHVG